MKYRPIAAWSVTIAGFLGPLALGLFVASKAVTPSLVRRRNVRIRRTAEHETRQCVVLQRSKRTESPGTFSLWFDGGHAQIGAIVRQDSETVTREIIRVDEGDLASVRDASWSGYAHTSPASLGLKSTDVEIATSAGIAPAWRVEPASAGQPTDWAIHIHGLGSSRAGMLRGVKVAADLGLTSLVVTYRNDGEGPHTGSGKTTLGQDEAEDVECALEYAIQNGASRIVLFGWSMGATIAFSLATDSPNAALIEGIVAVSPVLDWKQTLQANCRRAGLPAFCGTIAGAMLDAFPWSRILGLPHPLALHDFNWLARADELRQPVLLIHGRQDRSTPSYLSEHLSSRRPDLVSFVIFDSDHTLEWNSNPEKWEQAVSTWVAELSSINASG